MRHREIHSGEGEEERAEARPPEPHPSLPLAAGNQAVATFVAGLQGRNVVARQPDGFSGPSYARKGPEGSVLSERRGALAGGGAAMTQEVDNSCLNAVEKLGKSAVTLYKVAEDLDKRSKEGWRISADKDLVALAEEIKGAGTAVHDIVKSVKTLKEKNLDFSKTQFVDEPEVPSALGVLKGSLDSLAEAPETQAALEAFQANPNRDTAKAWAKQVGKQFSALKGVVNAVPFPPQAKFLQEFFAGMLGAPEAYIGALSALMEKRWDEIDAQSGIGSKEKRLTEGSTEVWVGDASSIVQQSFFVGEHGELYDWIKKHQHIDGHDLWTLRKDNVLLLLIKGIGADPAVTAEQRRTWVDWLQSQR